MSSSKKSFKPIVSVTRMLFDSNADSGYPNKLEKLTENFKATQSFRVLMKKLLRFEILKGDEDKKQRSTPWSSEGRIFAFSL